MKTQITRSLLGLHLIVFIYGFTAILGKLIQLDAIYIVWYRVLFASLGLGAYLMLKKRSLKLPPKAIATFLLIGLVVALHWISFFHAIKISNVSVTLGALSTGTLFASILEPVFFRKKINALEVFIGLGIIIGLYLIFRYELNYINGILVALLATILSTLFTIFNKSLTNKYDSLLITFYEMVGGFSGITLYFAFTNHLNTELFSVSFLDIVYLLILGLICTAFAFVVSVRVMRTISAYTVILAINLEPVYGIILAYFIFGQSEFMSTGFYIGTIVILLSVFLYPMIKKRVN